MRLVRRRVGGATFLSAVEAAQETIELPAQCIRAIGKVVKGFAGVESALASARFDSSLFFAGLEEYAGAENKRSAAMTLRKYYAGARSSLERLGEALGDLREALQEYSRACGDPSPVRHMHPQLLEDDARDVRRLIGRLDEAYSERRDGSVKFEIDKALDRYDYNVRNIANIFGTNVIGLAVRQRR